MVTLPASSALFHRRHRSARLPCRRFRAPREAAIVKIGSARTPQQAAAERPKPRTARSSIQPSPLCTRHQKGRACTASAVRNFRFCTAAQERRAKLMRFFRFCPAGQHASAPPVCAPKHLCAFSQVRDACFLETPLPRSSFCLARCSKREVLKLKGDVWRAGWYKGENFARGLAPLALDRYKGENFAQRPAGTACRNNLHLRDAASPGPQKASRAHGERSTGSHAAHLARSPARAHARSSPSNARHALRTFMPSCAPRTVEHSRFAVAGAAANRLAPRITREPSRRKSPRLAFSRPARRGSSSKARPSIRVATFAARRSHMSLAPTRAHRRARPPPHTYSAER